MAKAKFRQGAPKRVDLRDQFPFIGALLGNNPRLGFAVMNNDLCRTGASDLSAVEKLTIPTQVVESSWWSKGKKIVSQSPALWEQGSKHELHGVSFATIIATSTGGVIQSRDVHRMSHSTEDSSRQALVKISLGSIIAFGSQGRDDTHILIYKIMSMEALPQETIDAIVAQDGREESLTDVFALLDCELVGYYFSNWTGSKNARKEIPEDLETVLELMKVKLTKQSPFPINVECFETIGPALFGHFKKNFEHPTLRDPTHKVITVRPIRFLDELKIAVRKYREDLAKTLNLSDREQRTIMNRSALMEIEFFPNGETVDIQATLLRSNLGTSIDGFGAIDPISLRATFSGDLPEDLIREPAISRNAVTATNLCERLSSYEGDEVDGKRVINLPMMSDL